MDGLRFCKGTYPSDPLSDPPPPATSVLLLILLSFYFHFTCSYLLSPSGRILRRTLRVLSIGPSVSYPSDPPCPIHRTLRVLSVGPYYIHTFILRFIFNYRTISIYIISRTFYSLP